MNIMVRKSLFEKLTFQLKPKRLEGAHDAKSSRKSTLGGENNVCKLPEVGENLTCWRK